MSKQLRNIGLVVVAGVIVTCLCLIGFGIFGGKKTATQDTSTTIPAVSAPATSQNAIPTASQSVSATKAPTSAAVDSRPTGLIVDATKLIGATRSTVEAVLGKPTHTDSYSAADNPDDLPNGGEVRTYQVEAYAVEVHFDSKMGTTGVQVTDGLKAEHWALTDWPTLAQRLGLDLSVAPDVSNNLIFRWRDVGGYGILIANDKQDGQVWSVRVFLCQYSSLLTCSGQ